MISEIYTIINYLNYLVEPGRGLDIDYIGIENLLLNKKNLREAIIIIIFSDHRFNRRVIKNKLLITIIWILAIIYDQVAVKNPVGTFFLYVLVSMVLKVDHIAKTALEGTLIGRKKILYKKTLWVDVFVKDSNWVYVVLVSGVVPNTNIIGNSF